MAWHGMAWHPFGCRVISCSLWLWLCAVLPMQVPLSPNYKFPHMYAEWSKGHWNPEEALTTAYNMVQDKVGPNDTATLQLDRINGLQPIELTAGSCSSV